MLRGLRTCLAEALAQVTAAAGSLYLQAHASDNVQLFSAARDAICSCADSIAQVGRCCLLCLRPGSLQPGSSAIACSPLSCYWPSPTAAAHVVQALDSAAASCRGPCGADEVARS